MNLVHLDAVSGQQHFLAGEPLWHFAEPQDVDVLLRAPASRTGRCQPAWVLGTSEPFGGNLGGLSGAWNRFTLCAILGEQRKGYEMRNSGSSPLALGAPLFRNAAKGVHSCIRCSVLACAGSPFGSPGLAEGLVDGAAGVRNALFTLASCRRLWHFLGSQRRCERRLGARSAHRCVTSYELAVGEPFPSGRLKLVPVPLLGTL